MEYFTYGEKEISHLKARDPVLGQAIDRIGMIKREVHTELFAALVNSIVGQQISTKAQVTVWNRMKEGLVEVTPQKVGQCTKEELQSFGISFRKAEYIKTAAERVLNGSLDLRGLSEAEDEQVKQELTKLPGVGVWTAEMLMTFSMQRPDIVSYSDLAIQRGMRSSTTTGPSHRNYFKNTQGDTVPVALWPVFTFGLWQEGQSQR